jgi:NadR type nicotinamide-nucleotide adenylyltransferase
VVCLHGVESTGKSTLAPRLAKRFGGIVVPEYGRIYCETNGLDLSPADLTTIAETQQEMIDAAGLQNGGLVIADTDALMTAAWSEMLFGSVPPAFMAYPKADLYLLFDKDVPWVDDGTRFFGTPELRARFAVVSQGMLDRAGVSYRVISGDWAQREAEAVAAIEALITKKASNPQDQ